MTDKEKTKARNLMNQYKLMHDKLDTVLIQIESLNREKDLLTAQINELRKEDKEFLNDLQKEYGPGRIQLSDDEIFYKKEI